MPLHSDLVGARTDALTHDVDARWLMAYAAALGDFNPLYVDTEANTVVAHPVFPVCVEWPVNLLRPQGSGAPLPNLEESARAVHGAHDLHLHRPIAAGEKLTTQATVVAVRASRAGAVSITRLDTNDAISGELVARTYQSALYRGVAVEGADQSSEEVPALPELAKVDGARCHEIDVPEGAAHTYTECARIWNPIHTDRAVALAAGLPDIILHGTATLARAVTHVVNAYADGLPMRVTRLGCRFSAMVLMPSTLTLESRVDGNVISYQVRTAADELALSEGFVCLDGRLPG